VLCKKNEKYFNYSYCNYNYNWLKTDTREGVVTVVFPFLFLSFQLFLSFPFQFLPFLLGLYFYCIVLIGQIMGK